MRPSWPPPMQATSVTSPPSRRRIGTVEHGLRLCRAIVREPLPDPGVAERQDRRREQCRVDGARRDRSRASRPERRRASARSRATSPSPSGSSTPPERRAPAARSSRPPSPADGQHRLRPRSEPGARAPRRVAAYSKSRSGVRWAETTRCSNSISSASSVSAACCIVSQSEREPMISPTRGEELTTYFRFDFFTRSSATDFAVLRTSGSASSSAAMPSRMTNRLPRGRAVLEADDRQPPHRDVRVPRREVVEEWPERVDVSRMRAREAFERDQCRSAHRRALVLEAAAQQLDLLAEAELGDRTVGDRTNPVVGVAGRRLDLVAPLAAQRRELALEPALGVLVGEGRCLRQIHLRRPAAVEGRGRRTGRTAERADPSRFCSMM